MASSLDIPKKRSNTPTTKSIGVSSSFNSDTSQRGKFGIDRITDVVSVRKLLQDGGAKDVEVIPEEGVQTLRSADDWWTMALGSGLRWTIDQMGLETAARVKGDNVSWLKQNRVDRVETNAIYAIGTKRS